MSKPRFFYQKGELASDGWDVIVNDQLPGWKYTGARVSTLSGGEQNRLLLAKLMINPGNFLILDEPTNDLDVETLSSLENALLEFPGCAVVITHDRWFLDRVASHILAYEGTDDNPDQWYWFEGNFEAYEENKIARLGPEAAKPHRSTYRRLTRD
jgi:ATPase subunit of ABC transporter with duplicated ATPase domains